MKYKAFPFIIAIMLLAACNKDSHEGISEAGAIQAPFSVSDSTKVLFSMGNLQYCGETDVWRFAEHQYNFIGDGNVNIDATYSDFIDLFGFGTSGWNSGAAAYQPYAISTNYNDYSPADSSAALSTLADWGYNAIENGGGQAGVWRTLTKDEWTYLLNSRPSASQKYALARVNRTEGLLLLPDGFSLPDGLSFTPGTAKGYKTNSYTVSQFSKMQAAGAVFLPAAGYRKATDYFYPSQYGFYWSASVLLNNDSVHSPSPSAYVCFFGEEGANPQNYSHRDHGLSVRLVQDF